MPIYYLEVTDEEVIKLGNYYLSGQYLIRNLEIVRKRKQKALEGLAYLEAAETEILERMVKMQITPKLDMQGKTPRYRQNRLRA